MSAGKTLAQSRRQALLGRANGRVAAFAQQVTTIAMGGYGNEGNHDDTECNDREHRDDEQSHTSRFGEVRK